MRVLLVLAAASLGLACGGAGTTPVGGEGVPDHQPLLTVDGRPAVEAARSYSPLATLFDATEDRFDTFALRRVAHRYTFSGNTLDFEPVGKRPQLVLPVPDSLDGVQAFEIVARIPEAVGFQLLYAAKPPKYHRFDISRIAKEPAEDGFTRFIFDLADAGVTGADTRYLQLRFTPGAGGTVALRSIRALRYADRYLTRLAAARREITLNQDTRPARLVEVPSRHPAEVRLPSDPYLSAALGVPVTSHALTGEVEASVHLLDEEGARTDLYSTRLSPATNPRDRQWREILVPLTRWANRKVTLVFELRRSAGAPTDAPAYAAWSSPAVFQADRRTPSVVVVLEDTLRADRLHAYGYPEPISPRRDDFFHHSTAFRRAYSTSSWTLPAHASLFTSLRPLEHGVDTSAYSLGADAITLAETYRLAGYATIAVTDGGFVSSGFGLHRGFERFREFNLSLATTEDRLAQLEAYIESVGPRPFFLFFHHYQTHEWKEGYTQFVENVLTGTAVETRLLQGNDIYESQQYSRLSHESRRAVSDSLYDSAVAASDHLFGRVFDSLEARRGDRPQIQVLMSDHGEMLEDEPGVVGHGRSHHEPLIRVPLMIRLSWMDEHRVVDDPVQIIDVYPTLLALSGLTPLAEIQGRSLASTVAGASPPPRSRSFFVETNKDGVKITSLLRRDQKFNYQSTLAQSLEEPVRGDVGAEEWFRIASNGSEPAHREDGPVSKELRDAVFGYLQSVDQRYLLRVSNRSTEQRTLTGHLELTPPGRGSHDPRDLVRDWGLEADDALAVRKGSVRMDFRFSLEPGDVDVLVILHAAQSLRIHLSDETGQTLSADLITLGDGTRHPESLPIELAAYPRQALASEHAPAEPSGFSVSLWKTSGFTPFEVNGSRLDEEMVERLRALGYL